MSNDNGQTEPINHVLLISYSGLMFDPGQFVRSVWRQATQLIHQVIDVWVDMISD